MRLEDSEFKILAKNKPFVLTALKAMPKKHYAWVDFSEVQEAKNLAEALSAWSFSVLSDEHDNVNAIDFGADKLGNEKEMLTAIASWVEDGSFLEFRGEDGRTWRWSFSGGKMKELRAKLVWEE